MKILFYGRLGDLVGREMEVEAGPCTVSELRRALADTHPDAAPDLARNSVRACVADVIVGEEFELDSAAVVEFFPPLSGG